MAVTASVLTFDANSTTQSSYATASIAPGANSLLLVAVSSTRSDGAEIGSITGLGLTFTRVDGDQFGSSPVRRLSFWKAETGGSAPTPGTLSLNYPSGPTSVLWAVIEVTGADTAAPIVQSKVITGTATSLTVTFDSAPAAGNGIVTCTGIGAQEAFTPGTGMTELTEDTIGGPNGALHTQWRNSGASSASSSWTSSVGAIMVGLEVKAAGGGGTVHTVEPDDATHGHTAGSPTVTQVHVVEPADAAHAHTASSPALTQTHSISPAAASHGHTATSPTLTQVHVITPDGTVHAHTASEPTLTSGLVVEPDDAAHLHSAGSPAVTQVHVINPDGTSHTLTSGSPTVAQVHQVAPASTSHGHTATSPTVTQTEPAEATPASRTLAVEADDRTLTIAAEDRTLTIPAETRRLTIT